MTRILLADDDFEVRETLKEHLELEEEIEVVEAKSGESALDLLGKEQVDFVIADLFMPPLNGLELLRKYASKFDIFIITGTPEFKEECISLGARAVFIKPFDIARVINEILVFRLRAPSRKVGV